MADDRDPEAAEEVRAEFEALLGRVRAEPAGPAGTAAFAELAAAGREAIGGTEPAAGAGADGQPSTGDGEPASGGGGVPAADMAPGATGGEDPPPGGRVAADTGLALLAGVLTEPAQPLWARETAAFVLGCAGDRRAFETLVLLLNHRDPERCATAAFALARLGDPRTARAAAALATNRLRTAYALHPVRLLTVLRAPESVPALITTLGQLLGPGEPGVPGSGVALYGRVALACVEGLGALGDRRAVPVLTAAAADQRLAPDAAAALGRLDRG